MQRSQSWIIPTVMSPEKGGPVYNQLRANFAYTRRMIQRHPFRWIHDNWDFERQALVNVPEPNLEIRKNQWMHFVDAAYWDGIVGRFLMSVQRSSVHFCAPLRGRTTARCAGVFGRGRPTPGTAGVAPVPHPMARLDGQLLVRALCMRLSWQRGACDGRPS